MSGIQCPTWPHCWYAISTDDLRAHQQMIAHLTVDERHVSAEEMTGTVINGLSKTEQEISHGKLIRYYDTESSPPRMTKSELHLPSGGVLEQRWAAWGSRRDWPTPAEALADRVHPEQNPYHWWRISTRFVTPWRADNFAKDPRGQQ